MYRNNEHFGDNRDPISNPPPPLYPPRRDMHHMDTFSNSLPLYYDMNPPPYEYLPQVQEGYDACYNWRDGNDLKRHHMLPQQQMQSQQMQSQMQSIQGHYGHQSP